jgi:hypothetical protein
MPAVGSSAPSDEDTVMAPEEEEEAGAEDREPDEDPESVFSME